MGEIFALLLLNPITNALVASYKLLSLLGVPYALGFSIILFSILIKIVLWPLVSTQIKSTAKMQKVSHHLSGLKEKHKDDRKKQQEEMMKLYKEHGINPAMGCLPFLVQLPVLWALYPVLTKIVGANSLGSISDINKVLYFDFLKLNGIWDTTFLGFSLSASPSSLLGSAPYLLLIPIATGVLQFFLSKMMMPDPSTLPAVTTKKGDDFQSTFQKQSLFIFPIMIGFFSFTLPIGLSLYWNTFTVFGILQQYLLVGSGGAKPWFEKAGFKR